MDDDAAALLARWRDGDQAAATELFRRYSDRLVGLARSHLSGRLAQRLDPEDVVQSVYHSFFRGAQEGRYQYAHGGDFWRLLVAITLHKVYKKSRWHSTHKRSLGREGAVEAEANGSEFLDTLCSQEPSPLAALTLVDEGERIMRRLTPDDRQILELRLQGYQIKEIAAATSPITTPSVTEPKMNTLLLESKAW